MPTKQTIIDNIDQYSASKLVEYIKSGIVTYDELINEGAEYFPVNVRRDVQRLLAGSEDEDWQKAVAENTEESLRKFINTYPNSARVSEARVRIQQLYAGKEERDWQKAVTDDTEELLNAFINTYPNSVHISEAREKIRRIQYLHKDEEASGAWSCVEKNDIDDLQSFLKRYPDSPYCNEARKLINEIQRGIIIGFDVDALEARIREIGTNKSLLDSDSAIFDEIKKRIERGDVSNDDLVKMIRRDNNVLGSKVIKMLVDNGYLQYSDFEDIGIDRCFVEHLVRGGGKQKFNLPKPLEKIHKVSTEIYFWGIPTSGKSCALGAIMSVANNGRVARSMSKDPDCQGYGYMTLLSNIFKSDGKVGMLPESTSVYATHEMGFDLEDEKGRSHPITCIDLAGELVRCMYKSDADEKISDDEELALDTLTRVLIDNRTVNRKIHFFVLEYGGEARTYEGLSQPAYLEAALRYIERTHIFEKDTDAIYLMITKVDKTGAVGKELVDVLTDYIDENYRGFYQGLEKICRDNGINGGRVERVPFSLGKVCFQDFCLFNETPAANVVNIILTRSKGFKTGRVWNFLRIFKR